MWPFAPRKPKEPKPKTANVLRIEELQELAPVGSTFKYMGVECTVISNYGSHFSVHFGPRYWPEIEYQYADNLGVIRSETLSYTAFKAVLGRSE